MGSRQVKEQTKESAIQDRARCSLPAVGARRMADSQTGTNSKAIEVSGLTPSSKCCLGFTKDKQGSNATV